MKPRWILFLAVAATCLREAPVAHAQGAPEIVWEEVTPNTLANTIRGAGWSPSVSGDVAFGSTDRWMRTRSATNGALVYSVLQPHRSGSANQTIYSTDGAFLAVHNSSGGLGYRIHRAADGAFLWQDVAPRVERGLREWLLPSTTSAPYVEGDRLYYVTAECQLRCLDTHGFGDHDNDGPDRKEIFKDKRAADIVCFDFEAWDRVGAGTVRQ